MNNDLDEKIVTALEFPESRRVKGKARIEWICANCSNGNNVIYGILKINEFVGRCKYCEVTSLIKPEWEDWPRMDDIYLYRVVPFHVLGLLGS